MIAMYCMLLEETESMKHDIDAHNLCSAVVAFHNHPTQTFYSYSNPSALQASRFRRFNFVTAKNLGNRKIINRGNGPMSPDNHTEVRLLNHIYDQFSVRQFTSIWFFSTRTCCDMCRSAIYQFMTAVQIPVFAYEFRAEEFGYPTNKMWTITERRGNNRQQPKACEIDYEMNQILTV